MWGTSWIWVFKEKSLIKKNEPWLLNYSGILVMATNLNNTNRDYYSVQQDDKWLVKSFKFPKISWNSVSEEHVRVLQLISHSKRCGVLKLIQGTVCQKWLRIICVLQGSVSQNSYGVLQHHLEWAKCLILEVFESLFPSPLIYFDPNGNCSGPTAWAWMMFAVNIEPQRHQRKAESLRITKILQHWKNDMDLTHLSTSE